MKHGSLIAPDEGSFGFGAHTSATVETISTHADAAEFITVPDAHLLFSGEFKHSGNDLKIVGDDGKSFLVTDYFKTDKHPTLRSPDGATLNGDLVDLLAGPLAPGQYAQAGAPQASTAEAVGRVAVVTGNVTIIRNGVTVTVNAGDVILKNDVVQTGAGATCGLSLNDGSTFNLTGGARLAINEFVYDPNGTANASLTTLIQGAATFVAGQIAKTGDMKVATPVATMGIRGTAVILDINAVDGRVTMSIVDERDGREHLGEVFDRAGNLIATVTSNGGRLTLTPTATLDVIASFTNKTADMIAREFDAFRVLLSTYDAAKQFFPSLPDRAEIVPKGTNHAEGTGIQPSNTTTGLGDPNPLGNQGKTIEYVITKNVETPGTGPDNHSTDPNAPTGPGEPVVLSSGVIKYGTIGNDTIEGTSGNDFIYAGAGDDTIVAGHGEGNDFYDGDGDNGSNPSFAGSGSDKITFHSTNNAITFNLFSIAGLNTADNVDTGHDTFTNIERIESGGGNDVFYLHGNDLWHIDAGDGIDTVALVGDLDITEQAEGPDISHLEIIDLNTTGSNTIDFDAEGAFDSIEDNDTGYLQIKGTSADRVNLTNDGPYYQGGVWRLADEGELTELGGVQYVHYVFNHGDAEANVYIQAGIVVGAAVEDRFNSHAYNLNDGSNDWATNWTETNDDFSGPNNSPTDGEIFISHDPTTSSGDFQLTLTDKDAESDGADTIQRSVDLTGASSATLTFDYRRVDMENDDAIQIYASDGESFVLIGQIEGNGLDDQTYQTFTFDLTPFISANTTIQFAVDDRLEDGDTLYIDNVKIAYQPGENEAPVIHIDQAQTGDAAPYGEGWVFNGDNGHYYRLVKDADVSWDDAKSAAASHGAYLATITSAGEQTFVTNVVGDTRAWLGGYSDTTENATSWHWVTGPEAGMAFDYSHWRPGEPNGWDVPQGALHIEGVDTSDGGWNDAPTDAGSRVYVEEWGGRFADENSTTLSLLSISDANNGGDDVFDITVVAQHGTLSMANPDLNALDKNSSASGMLFHATLSEVNDALQHGVVYTNSEVNLPGESDDTDKVTLTVTDQNGASDTVNFLFNVFGEGGVTLTATAGKDVLFATESADRFIFDHDVGPQGIGHDTVTAFTAGVDKIDLGGGFATVPVNYETGLVDFDLWKTTEVSGHDAIEQVGANTVIHLSAEEDITLKNVVAASLTANDFIIHPGGA